MHPRIPPSSKLRSPKTLRSNFPHSSSLIFFLRHASFLQASSIPSRSHPRLSSLSLSLSLCPLRHVPAHLSSPSSLNHPLESDGGLSGLPPSLPVSSQASIGLRWLLESGLRPSPIHRTGRYPTVEKRAQFFNGPSYVPIPEDGPFLKALLFELRLTDEGQHFVECRDGCSRINKTSVYTLQVERKDLWPVVAFRKNGLIYVGLPLVEQSLIPQPPLFSISGISQAFDFLLGLLAFMNSNQKSEADRSTKVAQLPSLVMQACPLGTPLDTNLNGSLENSHVAVSSHTQKPPAWRSNTYKGKPQVNICIIEKVKSVQYDQRDVADMWQVYGTITCKCDIEGTAPNVTVGLNLPANGSPLQDILVHPCVTSLDSAILTSSSVDAMDDSAFSGPYKFPLIPPSDLFNLCFYTSQVPVPPILGFYQLKEEESQWKFTIHLKLHESMKNTFEYCKAYIPFFNRGPITHLEYKISYGQLEVSKEKSLFIWFIGQKFPKSLEISLTGTVAFGPTNQDQPVDAVCTGNTAYVKLYFKILDFTLTGCYTDQHSIQVFSSGKAKINTAREVLSSDYYIWNSKAPAPVVYRTLLF